MSKYIGDVSAYAYAVSKGYTGTEEEFAELMASYADVGQTAVDAKDAAVAAKTAAQTAATTATNKASEATTAAQTATTKAGEAQTSAQTASSKASEASQSASQASGYAQTAETAKTDAQTAKTQADTARDEAVTAKTAAETAQGKAEDAQAAAESVAESIPSDYSQLSEDVSDLKEGLTAVDEKFEQEIPQNFIDRAEVNEQLEYTYAEGLYVDDVNKKAKAGSYNSYGFKVPTGGRYYFSSPGDFVSEKMTEAGQVFSFHQAITAGWNSVPCAGYYYKYNSTSIYAYGTTIVSYENLLKRGNVFSYVGESASVRYTQGTEVQATTVSALIGETYISNYSGSYRLKSFAVAKGITYIFKCDAYSSTFDVPLMMFVKYGKPDTYSTRAYGYAMPYRANKVKSFEIPFYAVEDGFIYVQTNNSDTLTIKCYEITKLESIPKQYPQYKKMLTIGDSLTSNGIWQPVVSKNLFIPQSSTVAVAGKCISNNGDDPIYSAVMALTADSAVDLITLWAGTNDFAANITLSTLEEQIETATRDNTTFYGGVLDCVEHLINLYPKKRIIMIGTTPRTWNNGASDYQKTPNGSGKYLRDYVDAFHEVAKYYGLPFLDLLRTSGINLLNITQYMQQQEISGTTYYLHPTSEGYKYIGGLISAFIKSVG